MGFFKRCGTRKAAMAVALAGLLAVSACGGSDDSKKDAATGGTTKEVAFPKTTGPIGSSPDGGTPTDGGVLRVILGNNDHAALDPIKNFGSGAVGLNDITAIYDALMRYDPVADKYMPQLAESLTANADNTEYTLKLRPGVKFTDGTPLDSAAVKFGFERFNGPGSVFAYGSILPEIKSLETPDPLTVVIKLDGPDASFPYMLTLSFGQVVSPTAVQKLGEKEFNLHPVGAGPFMVKTYTPNVALDLVRNPNYWGPAPHLAGIHFSWANDDQAKVQALKNGDADVVSVADPVQTKAAIGNGNSGFGWLQYATPVVEMNMREGSLFSDKRLRQAAAYAIDPEVISSRVFQGLATPSKELFPIGRLHSGAPGLVTDADKARALVKEVKDTTGWDGSFTLISSSEPAVHNVALNVQAMLNDVGFHAVVETPADWIDSVYVKFDFTAAVTSLGMLESDPWAFMILEAGGAYSASGFQSPEMDAALLELRAASTQSEMRAAAKKMQAIWSDVVPTVWLGAGVRPTFWSSKVHGLVPSASSVLLFGKAWLER